jgi:hypothetical protein
MALKILLQFPPVEMKQSKKTIVKTPTFTHLPSLEATVGKALLFLMIHGSIG